MTLAAGTQLGRYEIRSKLGAGGMGEVYLAEDSELHRSVALKVLPADVSSNRDRMRRFKQEATAAAALNHPNIAHIYEIGEREGTNFIAMEFVDGLTLRQLIHERQTELSKLLRYLQHVAEGLAKAHAVGIVHRDLKPDNIMVTREGHAKILDFGLAKLIEQQTSQTTIQGMSELATALIQPHSMPGAVVGTVGYMSPEQAQGRGQEIDHRSDIFSFGCILYEAITRRKAFEGKDAIDSLNKIIREQPTPIANLNPEVPYDLQKIVRRCLAKDPEERYQSIKDIAIELKEVRRELQARGSHLLGVEEAKQVNSIAVLPLENTSGDPEIEYLADGISESLIDDLSQFPGVKVIARTSSFKYRGKDVDLQSVAKALRVHAMVSGRVTQRGDQLQIRAELIDTRDGTQIWGEQYSRRSMDLLSVQAEISAQIADKLRLRLTSGERPQLGRHDTAKPQAYELLLRGRFYRNKGGTENLKKAVRYCEQAIDTDPNYALAHAELSTRYSSLVAAGILHPGDYLPKAEAAARRALELDSSLADAHFALAGIILLAWDWPAAGREYQRAIKSNPNLAVAHGGYAHYLSLMGQHERAVEEIERARELDPLSLPVNVAIGFVLYLARQYDESIAVLNEVLELDQNYSFAHLYLGYNYAAKAMYAEAIDAFREAIKRGDNTLSAQVYLAVAYAKVGQRKKARAILKSLQESTEFVSPCKLAILYDSLGERGQAFALLETAYDAHDFQLAGLRVDPAFDSLREDRKFSHLLRRVGLN